jgi:predicted RNA-binding Zn-ribbon protein involved in translation (DUF1610 family)
MSNYNNGFNFDEYLASLTAGHCDSFKPQVANWEEPIYCSCGAEIDKIPPVVNIAEFLEKGEINFECPDCGADITIELSVRESAITWGQLFYLWDNLGVDIFPAIKCQVFIDEVVA